MAQSTSVGLGTGWSEVYMGGSREAERALFAAAFPRVEAIQEFVAQKQHAVIRRAFHNRGVAFTVEFEVSPDLPDHLRVGFLTPGAAYRGFGRFSRSQSFHGRDGELDQRGFAFRLETPGRSQDFLFSNTPASFAPDPVMFLRVATIFTENSKPIVPFKLFRAIGIREGVRVLRNLLQAPDRSVAFTSQRFWSRTPFEIGATASRLFVRPISEPRRVEDTKDPDFLTVDLRQDLRQRARSFELCAQLFVDETTTPIEDSSHEWLETVARPVVLGRVVLPQQDLDGAQARELADRIDRSESFNPWNTPCLRPLGRTNRARREAYNRSATNRGAQIVPAGQPVAHGAG
jgi:catalase